MTTSVNQVSASENVKQAIESGKGLPILDVGPYLAGEPGALEQLAADVRWIQENLGFFAIVNHGIPQELIDESFRQTAQLFEIPMEEKLRHRVGFHHQAICRPRHRSCNRPPSKRRSRSIPRRTPMPRGSSCATARPTIPRSSPMCGTAA